MPTARSEQVRKRGGELMSRQTEHNVSALRWLALDIGGANLKAVHADGSTKTQPFEVWRHPSELSKAIAKLGASFPPFERVAVTMTAELCDCYSTKADGVLSVLEAVAQALGESSTVIWGMDGRLHEPDLIRQRPLLAAAANWLALATVAARIVPEARGLLIDIGSTTTDIIPLCMGSVWVQGRTDTERLRTGELVYAGTRRTPLCALATELPLWSGTPTGLAAELFATTLDVFLTLGDIEPDPSDLATADGRGSTVDAARDRLARMVGGDRTTFSAEDAVELSRSAANSLLNRLTRAARRVSQATIGKADVVVVAGSGEFLAQRLAARVLEPMGQIISLGETWGRAASTAGCAHALLSLATENESAS
jgi:probable H4MPT-linked C1 transfer pathway protein